MHPVLFRIGDFSVHTYGVTFGGMLMVVALLGYRRAPRDGVDQTDILMCYVLAVVGVFVMSKLLHVVTQFDWYLERPKRLLDLRTGHVFYGGYIGAITFPLIYTLAAKVRIRPIFDITSTYMPLALAVHRGIGCFSAGCCFGRPTDAPWAVTFPARSLAAEVYGVVPVHPTQLYEAGAGLVMLAILLYWRKHYYRVAGELFALQVALYAVARFIIEFYRGDEDRGGFSVLSTSQWVSIGMLGLAAVFAVQIGRERRALPARG